MKNFVLIAIIGTLILTVLYVSLQDNQSINQENQDIMPGEDIAMNSSIVDENKLFKDWFTFSYESIYSDINCIRDAAKNQDFNRTARCGEFLEYDSNISLTRIDEFTVSNATLQIVLREYKKSLIDYNIGGLMLETGAKDRNITLMGDATARIQNGSIRIDSITDILRSMNMSYT